MKNFFLIPNPTKDTDFSVTAKVSAFLLEKGAKLFVEAQYAAHLQGVIACQEDEIPSCVEALIVLGGDGSVIHTAPIALERNLPIVGVNLGYLGYLTVIEPNDFEKLALLLVDEPETRSHIVLNIRIVKQNGKIIEQTAINDVVVGKNNEFSMADISLTDMTADHLSLNYRADGLIVCTPLGSTAYSLSAGGPIMDSAVDAFCVTPICPHSFFSRSILFTSKTVLRLTNESRKNLPHAVNIDGRNKHTLLPGEFVDISVSEKKLTFLCAGSHGVLDALRRKMLISDVKQ